MQMANRLFFHHYNNGNFAAGTRQGVRQRNRRKVPAEDLHGQFAQDRHPQPEVRAGTGQLQDAREQVRRHAPPRVHIRTERLQPLSQQRARRLRRVRPLRHRRNHFHSPRKRGVPRQGGLAGKGSRHAH